MSNIVSVEKHTVIDSVTLTLTPDQAKEVYGLVSAASINYVSDTLDAIAFEIDREFEFQLMPFVQDENGEFGPYQELPTVLEDIEDEDGDCGCDFDNVESL